jgi:hypothetical protein
MNALRGIWTCFLLLVMWVVAPRQDWNRASGALVRHLERRG